MALDTCYPFYNQDCNADPLHLSAEGIYTGEFGHYPLQAAEHPSNFLTPETLDLSWPGRNGSVSTAHTSSDCSVAEFSYLGAETDTYRVPDLVPSSQQKRGQDSPERPPKRHCSQAAGTVTKATGPATRSKENRPPAAPNITKPKVHGKAKPNKCVGDKPRSPPSSASSSRGATVKAPQLRTASRKPKASGKESCSAAAAGDKDNSQEDGMLTFDERRARQSHNLVEKQYRNRLNQQFESLLAVLPPADSGNRSFSCGGGGNSSQSRRDSKGSAAGPEGAGDDRRLSKAEVLDMARQRIITLERECDRLNSVKLELAANVGVVRDAVAKGGIAGTAMAA